MRRICGALQVGRSAFFQRKPTAPKHEKDGTPELIKAVRKIIVEHPTFGYCRIWAIPRFKEGFEVSRKRGYRILRKNRWFCNQRSRKSRPQFQRKTSLADSPNAGWAMGVTRFPCGRDGLAHLIAVIASCNRKIVGCEMAGRSRANEAERDFLTACAKRFGTLRQSGANPVIRSENGLFLKSHGISEAYWFYRLAHAFLPSYTPAENGVMERFFRFIKEECAWQHNSGSFGEGRTAVFPWFRW